MQPLDRTRLAFSLSPFHPFTQKLAVYFPAKASTLNTRRTMALETVLSLPSSQSIANRAFIIAALTEGTTVLEGSFLSGGMKVMANALRQIGLKVNLSANGERTEIIGRKGIFPVDEEYLDVENSILAVHFLAAALAFSRGLYRINGDRRVQQFPLGDLIFVLNQLGADIRSENAFDTLPLLIHGVHGRKGISPSSRRYAINAEMSGKDRRFASLTGTVSSQYLCGILLASPLAAELGPVELHVVNQLSCDPYVRMTLDLMEEFGVKVKSAAGSKDVLFSKGTTLTIPKEAEYIPRTYRVEPDAVLANYAFAAAAIGGGKVAVRGLNSGSIQKEMEFIHCLSRMGCSVSFRNNTAIVRQPERALLRGISVDMNDMTGSIQTFAVCALFAESPSRVSNIGHLRRMEPDRLPKLFAELRKFGANITEFDDGFMIIPNKELVPAVVAAEGDARLAMGLGLIGLRLDGVRIDDADCVHKVWPSFFDDLGLNHIK